MTHADIALLTIIPAELAALHAELKAQTGPIKLSSGTNLWMSSVASSRDRCNYTVAFSCIASAGNNDCAAAATEMLMAVRPKILLVVGIAAGLRGKTRIGQVVLSDRVVAYEHAAIKPSGTESRAEANRAPHSIEQDVAFYLSCIKRGKLSQKICGRTKGHIPKPDGKHPPEQYEQEVAQVATIASATIASGEKLLRDPSKLVSLREHVHGKIEVGEMEAAGLVAACRRTSTDWLVVRGISDFGDDFKNDKFHQYASRAAAIVAVDFLKTGLSLCMGSDTERQTIADKASQLLKLTSAGIAKFSPEHLEQATCHYRDLALDSCDIIDLAGLPEDDRNIAMQNFVMRQLYVPLRLELEKSRDAVANNDSPTGGERRRKRDVDEPESVGTWIRKSPRLVILGDPGGGKSTLVRWLATAFLLRLKKDPHFSELPDVSCLPEVDLLPIVVRCRELDDASLMGPLDDMLRQTLRKSELASTEVDALQTVLRDRLSRGSALLLVDGLDEISDPRKRTRFCQQIQVVARAYKSAPIVITSRIVGYREMGFRLGSGFTHTRLSELTTGDKDDFARKWCELTEPADRRERVAAELVEGIHSSDRIEKLTGNPMLLTTMALVKRKVGKLPSRRHELYAEAVQVLLNWRREVDVPLDKNEVLPQLEYLAYEMCRRGQQRLPEPDVLELLGGVRREFQHIRPISTRSPEAFLQLLERRTSILIQSGNARVSGDLVPIYEFRHLSFQEYLAGLALVKGRYPGHDRKVPIVERVRPLAAAAVYGVESQSEPDVRHVVHRRDMEIRENWREPLRLCVSCCNDDDVDDVVLTILLGASGENRNALRSRAILAGLCIADEPNISDSTALQVISSLVSSTRAVDGGGGVGTGIDAACVALARSCWRDALREALFAAYITEGSINFGGLFSLVGRPDGFRSIESLSALSSALCSDNALEQTRAALDIMDTCFLLQPAMVGVDGTLVDSVCMRLVALLQAPPATAQAAAWALVWASGGFALGRRWVLPSSARDGILKCLKRDDVSTNTVRFVAHTVGSESLGANALETLLDRYAAPQTDTATRLILLSAIGHLRIPESFAHLRAQLRAERVEIRCEALQQLIQLEEDARPFAELLSNDSDGVLPWLDPAAPVPEHHAKEVATRMGISVAEARRRVAEAATAFGFPE